MTLPGVARKTANVVLANADPDAFATDPDVGIAVDTHAFRLSHLLGLSAAKDPEHTESDLVQVVPRSDWNRITYRLIEHGRAVCTLPTTTPQWMVSRRSHPDEAYYSQTALTDRQTKGATPRGRQ